jgi:hypothetical protein
VPGTEHPFQVGQQLREQVAGLGPVSGLTGPAGDGDARNQYVGVVGAQDPRAGKQQRRELVAGVNGIAGLGMSWRLAVILGRAFGLRPRLLYPPGCFRIATQVEEPAKEREAISRLSPKPAAYGARTSANAPG